MKYRIWMGMFCVAAIAVLGLGNAWADAASQCTQLYSQKHYKAAFPVCKKAAEQGDAWAQSDLGFMHEHGLGTTQNYAESAKWYRKAAEQGYASAQYILGSMYDNGDGVKQDYSEAAKWYRKAAEQGNMWAQSKLTTMYEFGKGVRQDYAEAAKWYRKLAEKGIAFDQFSLGLMYGNGQGVRQDFAEAAKWYRKAAEQGYAEAQNNLGLMYGNGQGVRQDFAEAAKWYRKAAEQGDAEAQYNLGLMYGNGQGVRQDFAEAAKWWRKGAEQGNASAQFNLGAMYSSGRGVMKSGAAAADWYYKAGLSDLKQGKRDNALQSVERIKNLQTVLHLSVPNAFLANKLLARIYGENEIEQTAPKAKKKKAAKVVSGTGWPVVGGYIVTNHHVVAGHHHIMLVRRDGVKIKVTVIADDATNDLVLLKPASSKHLPPALPLANRPAQVGEQVFTVGYPHPDLMGVEAKLTQGIVNARTGIGNDPRVYQISVPLQGGNSGGPLINMRGEVVGVVASKLSAAKVFKWTGDMPQNVNYAIKSGYVQILLSSLDPASSVPVLPSRKDNLAGLAKRIEGSVLMVVAQ